MTVTSPDSDAAGDELAGADGFVDAAAADGVVVALVPPQAETAMKLAQMSPTRRRPAHGPKR